MATSNNSEYDYMADLLKQWGLEEYIEIFINQKVDAGCLRIIDDEDIKQIIPLAGDRARFKSNLGLWKAENVDASKTSEETPVVEVVTVGEIAERNITHSNEFAPDTFTLHETEPAETNSVLKLLKSSIDGKAILSYGEKNQGSLEQTLRSRLTRLIATKELTDNPTGIVAGSRLMKCAHEIAQIFPKESPATYYIPYMSATSRNIKRNASGKLYDAVCNKRRDLRSRGVITGPCRSSRSSSSEISSGSDVTSLTLSSVDNEVKTPLYLDVDKLITIDDIHLLYQMRWPWKKTHFTLIEKCYGCGASTNDIPERIFHFLLSDNETQMLLQSVYFYCQICRQYAVYDHFTNDECSYCN